ncbi:MAG TPA: hypothetical protein EYQ31_15070 [Candidatus Handelsmanbacteria bacterium]|nr:hypothetical protein [Candidatus Handelsmanbacteria bacterium]
MEELITLIDSSYRTRAEACWGCRCGGQSLAFGLGHSDIFGWVGAFSSAVFETFHDRLLDAERLHADLALLWIGCGHDDSLYQQNTRFIARMNARRAARGAHHRGRPLMAPLALVSARVRIAPVSDLAYLKFATNSL